MKRRAPAPSRFAASILLLFAVLAASVLAAEKPSLIVVISVDQMRADYLDRFRPWFQGAASIGSSRKARSSLARRSDTP